MVSCFYAELGNNCIYDGAFMVLFLTKKLFGLKVSVIESFHSNTKMFNHSRIIQQLTIIVNVCLEQA